VVEVLPPHKKKGNSGIIEYTMLYYSSQFKPNFYGKNSKIQRKIRKTLSLPPNKDMYTRKPQGVRKCEMYRCNMLASIYPCTQLQTYLITSNLLIYSHLSEQLSRIMCSTLKNSINSGHFESLITMF